MSEIDIRDGRGDRPDEVIEPARTLPPDPEEMNADRAEWAASSIRQFQVNTGADWDDALSDLLGDLMHFADREGFDFGAELERARGHYQAETMEIAIEREPLTLDAVEREPAATPQLSDGLTESQKADLAGAILSRMDDMHSNYGIDERNGGFALVRTFEIDDDGLRELGLPDEKEIGFADTREAMQEKIINRDGPFYIPELVADLDARLDLARAPETLTLEAIERDSNNAVRLPLPPDADLELLVAVADEARGIWVSFESESEAAHSHDDCEKLVNIATAARDRYFDANMRAAELVAEERSPRSEWDHALSDLAADLSDNQDRANLSAAHGSEHTARFSATLGSEQVARVVDIMLGAFVGYFVDEPILTPQQVHDTVRANDEVAESRAIEAAQIESDTALDRVNVGINHNRSPVHAGAGDVPHTPESIYDRYPGLTRDIEEDTREQERSYERTR